MGREPEGNPPKCTGRQLQNEGGSFPTSVLAHADSSVEYFLEGLYSTFTFTPMFTGTQCGDGAIFRVFLDGEELYESQVVFYSSAIPPVNLDVTNGRRLRLETESRQSIDCDWTTWGNPTLTVNPSPSEITKIIGGSYPLLAVVYSDESVNEIRIIELDTDRLIASLPVNSSGTVWDEARGAYYTHVPDIPLLRFSPDGAKLAYNDITDGIVSLFTFDIASGESKMLFSLPEGTLFEDFEWSFNGLWLSYLQADNNPVSRLYVYDFERDESFFVSSAYWVRWFNQESSFLYQNAGGSRLVRNLETGEEMAPPRFFASFAFLEEHFSTDIANSGCKYCFLPTLGLNEQSSRTADQASYLLSLFNPETEQPAFSGRYVYPHEESNFDFVDILPIQDKGFVFWIEETDLNSNNGRPYYSSIWSLANVELFDFAEATSRISNAIPLEISPDGSSLLVLEFAEWGSSWSVAVYDLASANKVYEFRAVASASLFNTTLRGIDTAWLPSE